MIWSVTKLIIVSREIKFAVLNRYFYAAPCRERLRTGTGTVIGTGTGTSPGPVTQWPHGGGMEHRGRKQCVTHTFTV